MGAFRRSGGVGDLVASRCRRRAPQPPRPQRRRRGAAAARRAADAPRALRPRRRGAAAPATGAAGGADQGAYTVRLRSLEKNVNELKEQIFRTKARLNLLKETVLGGVIGASRAIIRHKNEMGSSFRLIKAAYALDGVQIYSQSRRQRRSGRDAGVRHLQRRHPARARTRCRSRSIYQGNGFGVFSYLKGYKFNVKSSHTFVAGESKTTNITVVGYEKGNITTQLSDKPAVDFRVNVIVGW